MKLKELLAITRKTDINKLTEEQIKELQTALNQLGYPAGDIDGLVGPKTRSAWSEFKADVYEEDPVLINPDFIAALQKRVEDAGETQGNDFSTREGTIDAIMRECRKQNIGSNAQIAYVLATVEWETNHTFKPVREAYWKSEEWRKNNFRYYPYYGRGYVQLTWEDNYKKYSQILGVDLVNNPDRAMDADIALFVLVHGFKTGTFTGRKITDYINKNKTDFVKARRCINGTDHAHDIARLAEDFLNAL
ncbi:MAG: glycoside hydrolase family 19 protein [Syntrophales bacterium]|jgi:hypothetical protein|nr:glycoside hydrolase family 19 protein [Syntrophales bacterium]NLN60892.1 carboxypeptidase [Deltaproteobacteria bacterium]